MNISKLNHYIRYITLVILIASINFGCNQKSKSKNTKTNKATKQSIEIKAKDTSLIKQYKQSVDTLPKEPITNHKDTLNNHNQRLTDSIKNITNWSIDDFIVIYPKNYAAELKLHIKYEREQWKSVKNPLIVTYTGNYIGDYFHLNFEDANGTNYDFGFGNNNYGKYTLFDNDYTDNLKFLGKSFILFWDWKPSELPCCDGEYQLAKAYLPSIIKLELTSTN